MMKNVKIGLCDSHMIHRDVRSCDSHVNHLEQKVLLGPEGANLMSDIV